MSSVRARITKPSSKSGMHSASAELLILFQFSSGLNIATPPSLMAYAFIPSNISCA